MAVNDFDPTMFNTTSLLEGVVTRFPVPSFLRDTFFPVRDTTDANVVQMDTKRGGRRLAPFVLPLQGQVVERRQPFSRSFVEAPIIAPARVITLREAGRLGFGENAYNYKTPEERIADIYAEDTQEMDDEIARTEEWMVAQCMCYGKIPIKYQNKTSVVIDYGFTNLTAVQVPWTDSANAKPLDDLAQAQSVLNTYGFDGSLAVYSPRAWKALWATKQVQDLMHNLSGLTPISSYKMGQAPNGIAQAPSFSYPLMENWVYSGTFTIDGQPQNFIPQDRVIVGGRNTRNQIIYSMVTQIEQEDGQFHSYMLDRVPKVECNVNKNFYMYTLTSRPVPLPDDLLTWTVLTDVA